MRKARPFAGTRIRAQLDFTFAKCDPPNQPAHSPRWPGRKVTLGCSGIVKQRALRFEASYEPSVAEGFGNLLSSPAYLTPAFLKVEPSSMNFRC